MGKNSKIEWTHHTFDPWWGCAKVSPACAHCYAETWARRVGSSVWGKRADRRFFTDAHWREPLKWNREAERDGVRRRVFCASMADVFEDRRDLDAPRARLWSLIEATPRLDWLLLTKRPGYVRARATAPGRRGLTRLRGRPPRRGRTGIRCVKCGSGAVTERRERTAQGYKRFRCRTCDKQFNERSGTLLNRVQYPSDVVALVVLWRLRYKLSLRDLPEMLAVRGITFCHETVREWEAKLTPALAEDLRRRRRGKAGRSWYVDETYMKVAGRWCYVYRAIDGTGALVDVLFSDKRDMAAARAFFRSAKAATGVTPDRVTTDGHTSYPRAIKTELGKQVRHRTGVHRNDRLEQDHRGLKGRYRPMRGFKCSGSAARFCRAYDELRNFLRPRSRYNQHVPAHRRRSLSLGRTATVLAILEAA